MVPTQQDPIPRLVQVLRKGLVVAVVRVIWFRKVERQLLLARLEHINRLSLAVLPQALRSELAFLVEHTMTVGVVVAAEPVRRREAIGMEELDSLLTLLASRLSMARAVVEVACSIQIPLLSSQVEQAEIELVMVEHTKLSALRPTSAARQRLRRIQDAAVAADWLILAGRWNSKLPQAAPMELW